MARIDEYGRKMLAPVVTLRSPIVVTPNEEGTYDADIGDFSIGYSYKAVNREKGRVETPVPDELSEVANLAVLEEMGVYAPETAYATAAMLRAMCEAMGTDEYKTKDAASKVGIEVPPLG